MARAKNNYYIDRTGSELSSDDTNIISDCNVITFINGGDWPCYIISANGNVKRYLDEGEEVSFGSDIPEVYEKSVFQIEFDTVNVGTVKSVFIERALYIEEPCEVGRLERQRN